ncbi:hypothetical protein O181_004518 [Austropuccinia psidii MF-1]|uniref:Uncharacterized protein n=1 Tax=Austropuccinia psidii MF-1 TaxID=1389203 RepID=A0A9Q3BGR5_9BASI|nr:hypothetical protein [Austropuccinia psidii MF-1]
MEPTPSSNNNSAPTLTFPTSTNDVSNIFVTLIQSQQSLTSLINNLKEDVDRMKVSNSTPKPNVGMKLKETCVPKTPASQKKFQCSKSEPLQATSNSQPKSHKASPTSSLQKITNKSPVKQNPLQMQKSDLPPDFQGVKQTFSFVDWMKLWHKSRRMRGTLIASAHIVFQRSLLNPAYLDHQKACPLIFYNIKWFKTLDHVQKQQMADSYCVAFFLTPEDCLKPKRHPDEKISDKLFSKKYCDIVVEPYELQEFEEEESGEDSIDLGAASPDHSESESDGLYAPGEYSFI